MHSKLYFLNVYMKTQVRPVIVTAQRTNNDAYGNPRYKVQVWALTEGHLWQPAVKGYRKKDESYVIQTYNIDDALTHFMKAFEEAIITIGGEDE